MPASSTPAPAGSRAASSCLGAGGIAGGRLLPRRGRDRGRPAPASARAGSRAAGSALAVIRRGYHRGRAIVSKVDARNRLDAVRIATEAGWR
ncbi:hypothetical protein [Nonomuraea jabiensis]|uniref:Uncharacterized protein n=1 Tax=Nonomuraea jabiensis TaxID=882448 RepID=A0A7W9LE48_9ACTN|nr:hypothetical protein [Nonomuraea jabiensis]MBB5780477.1 hypothetical protein [Nonomuraea jabiensis]